MRDNSEVGDELVVPGDAADDGTAPIRVFMSYRRADDHHFIGRLHDRLCAAFGDDMVFRDIDSIPAGTNFRSVILRTLNEVDAVVAVIGPNWAGRAGTEVGSDYVYLELAEALKQGKPVVPALLEGTPMPVPDTLPEDLRSLTEIHAIFVHGDPAFRRDSGRLIDAIRDVVASDRARIAQERSAAEEQARRVEAERAERERLTDELRAEERAARLRLAELEEVATRRQIELERARLEAIAERLRKAEAADRVASAAPEPHDVDVAVPVIIAPVEPPPVTAPPEPAVAAPIVPPPVSEPAVTAEEQLPVTEPAVTAEEQPPVTEPAATAEEQPPVTEPALTEPDEPPQTASAEPPPSTPTESPPLVPAEPRAASPTAGRLRVRQVVSQLLIVAAVVLGVISQSQDRTFLDTPFDELSYDSLIDVCTWIMTLAVGVPVLLGRRPVEQRFVLIGAAASAFFFEFLQASALVRYGTTGYDEGSWFVLKVLQAVCLVAAILAIRRGASLPFTSSTSVRVALVAIAAVSSALIVAALRDQWTQVDVLIESGYLKDRTPFVLWLAFLALGPVALTLGLATRRSYGTRLALATFTTLATVSCLAEARFLDQEFDLDDSRWKWTAAAYAVLAVVAWSTVIAGRPKSEPAA